MPYFPLSRRRDAADRRLQAGAIGAACARTIARRFDYAPELVDTIAARCTEVESGARNVDHILTRTLLPELSAEFLARLADGESISSVYVGVSTEGSFQFALNKA